MLDMDVQVETNKLYKSMERFARETGQELKEVFEDQMRLASNDLVRWNHPKAAKAGKGTVSSDVGSVVTQIGDWIVRTASTGTGIIAVTKTGAALPVDNALVNLQSDEMTIAKHHKRKRTGTRGNVPRGQKSVVNGRLNMMLVGRNGKKRYLRKNAFPKVGMVKAGWILPSGAPVNTRAPRWVQKAREYIGDVSRYEDAMDKNANGYLRLTNKVRHAARHGGLIKTAVRKRNAALNRFAGRTLDRMIDKFNAGRV